MTATAWGDSTPTFIGPVDLLGTCDWGGCDREAETVRWSYQAGYLSTCQPHSRPGADPPPPHGGRASVRTWCAELDRRVDDMLAVFGLAALAG